VRQLGLARILVEQRQPQAPALDTALAPDTAPMPAFGV
jgi:hypothetical protein